MKDRIRHLICFFIAVLTVVHICVPQPVSAEKQYVKEEIYFEDFNSVSDETLVSWNQTYKADAAEEGHWYTNSSTTLTLEDNTNSDNKALSMNGHVNGQNNYFYFKLPGDISADSIQRYQVSFDYYANGDWCDWFYLTNKDGTSASVNMSYAQGWKYVSMIIDLEEGAWKIGSYSCSATNLSSVLNGSDLTLIIRLHGNAAAGNKIKFDNFGVYKLYENPNYDIYDEVVSIYDKSGSIQKDKNSVDIKLGRITVDFGDEALDTDTITDQNILLDGDVIYKTSYLSGVLTVEIDSNLLEFEKEYTLTLDGLKLVGGKTVTKKEYKFKTMKNETVISGGAYIEYEDFESWTNERCTNQYTNDMIDKGGFRTWTTVGCVSGKDGGIALTPMLGASQTARTLQYYFVPKLENDTFVIDFDYYPGDTDNYNDIKFSIFRSKDGYGTTVVPKEGMTAFSKEWGHITLEVEPAKSTWSVVVTNAAGETVYENEKGVWGDSNITMLDWNVVVLDASKLADETNAPKIDNFIVNAIYTSEPFLSKKNISIYENGTAQDFDSVSPASNSIVVDFTQRMMPDDMSSDNIYITRKDNPSKKIATVDKYANGKYELSLLEYMAAGAQYTIYIKKCRNVSGFEMSKTYTFDFTVGTGNVDIGLESLMQNGAEVTNIASLSEGAAKLDILYKNSTGKPYILHYILSFFNDDEMVSAVYAAKELPDYATGDITELSVTVPNIPAEYDEMNITVWDSFDGMLPVCKALVLK